MKVVIFTNYLLTLHIPLLGDNVLTYSKLEDFNETICINRLCLITLSVLQFKIIVLDHV